MKAMLLAAGRGQRLKPITDNLPKPLIPVAGKPLITHHLKNLANAGITEIVINTAHLGEQIEQSLGNGHDFGVSIKYSKENPALETGGGIFNALPLLGPGPFIVINADIYTDFPLHTLTTCNFPLAHIILVGNPEHNLKGDYELDAENYIVPEMKQRTAENTDNFTFSGIGIYRPELFQHCTPGIFRLPTVFKSAIEQRQITGEIYQGLWSDIGTIDRWEQLNRLLKS